MPITINPIAASLTSDGTTSGYLTVSNGSGFYVGAAANLFSSATSMEVIITEVTGTQIGVRERNQLGYGRTDISAFKVADGAKICLLGQDVLSQPTPSYPSYLSTYNVKTYGAIGDGIVDDTSAIQTAIDACGSAGGGVVDFSEGTYIITKPLRIDENNVVLLGRGSTIKPSGYQGYAIAAQAKQQSSLPLTTALATGGGYSLDFTGISNSQDLYINLSDLGTALKLNGQSGMTARLFYKPTSTTSDCALVSSRGKLRSTDTAASAFKIVVFSGGYLSGSITTTTGTHSIQTGAGAIVTGNTYHIALDYDGTHLTLYLNGSIAAQTAVTGTIVQQIYEDLIVGRSTDQWPEQTTYNAHPNGEVYSVEVNIESLYTGVFANPTVRHEVNNGTIALLNFDSIERDFIVCQTNVGNGWLPYRDNRGGFGNLSNIEIRNLSFNLNDQGNQTSGIYLNNTPHAVISDCDFNSSNSGIGSIYGVNNAWYLSISKTKSGGSNYGIIVSGASGLLSVSDSTITCKHYPIVVSSSSATLSNLFINGCQDTSMRLFGGPGSTSAFTTYGVGITDEDASVTSPGPRLQLDTALAISMHGGVLEMGAHTSPCIEVIGQGNASFNGVHFKQEVGSAELIHFPEGASATANISLAGCYRHNPSVPLTTTPGRVFNLQNEQQSGSITVSDTATSGTVTFTSTEPDANYRIELSSGISSGTPAAGSTRAYWGTKTTTGFTVYLEVAPGTGNAVEVDWKLVR